MVTLGNHEEQVPHYVHGINKLVSRAQQLRKSIL